MLYGEVANNVVVGPKQFVRVNGTNNGFEVYDTDKHTLSEITDMSSLGRSLGAVANAVAARTLIGAGTSSFSGSYNDLTDKPSMPAAQVNSDWNAGSGVAQILNKPTIPAAQIQADWNQATTGALDYIKNKPTIPSITGLRKVETFLGTSDASGNYTITFANTYATAPDIQTQIVGGGFNQFIRVISVSTTQATVQVAQRNTVTLLSIEVLLGATVAVSGASVSIQVTPRS